MPEPHLRAADTDREAVATALGEHMAAGRLTVSEYDERLAQVYAAKTYGELDELTADLPSGRAGRPVPAAGTEHRSPVPAPQASGPACGPGWGGPPTPWNRGHSGAHAWRAWVSTSVIVLAIYLISGIAGDFGFFWPIWVIGPWGAVLLARTITDRGPPAGRRRPGR